MPTADHVAVYLSNREYDVIGRIVDGASYEDVANDLGITKEAVSPTLARCRRFYFCKTRAQLMFRLGFAFGRGTPIKRASRGGRPRKKAQQP